MTAAHPEAVPFTTPAKYVGAAVCKECHAAEYDSWKGSHHALAMQEANASTVVGDFDGATFVYHDVESK
ncbi:multiheme c-type cytochrome, partial [Enterococcus faecium]|uniref:multiheme c-type cytochrome n=1 Tax=Enterococcus faecium TaxID=1352 RepID=UPI003F430F4C